MEQKKVISLRCNETTYKSLQCLCLREKISIGELIRQCLDYGIMHIYCRSEFDRIEYELSKEYEDRQEYPSRYTIYD